MEKPPTAESRRERIIADYDTMFQSSAGREGDFQRTGFCNFGFWDETAATLFEANVRLVDKIVEPARTSGGKVLDVACGAGGTTKRLTKYFTAADITAINISEFQLERARANVPGATFLLMNAEQLDFPSESFDAVVCVEAAFHFATRARFIGEACRVLKPGGYLMMSDILLRPGTEGTESYPPANVYGKETYEDILRLAGFESISMTDVLAQTWKSFLAHEVLIDGPRRIAEATSDFERMAAANRARERGERYRYWNTRFSQYLLVHARKRGS